MRPEIQIPVPHSELAQRLLVVRFTRGCPFVAMRCCNRRLDSVRGYGLHLQRSFGQHRIESTYEKVSGGQQAGLRIRAPSFDFSDNSGLYFDEDQPRVRPLVVNVTVSDEMALQMGRRIDENSDRGLHSEPDVCCNWVHCRDGRFVGRLGYLSTVRWRVSTLRMVRPRAAIN